MALLHALVSLAGDPPRVRLTVAHLDHGVRGSRGTADADFVAREAARLGLPLIRRRARIARRPRGSWEAAAREARYAFLLRAAARSRSDRVATGHTADDQAETVLHRLCRGCGLRGAAAMAPDRRLARGSSVRLVRPLLGMTRADVLAYLRERRISFRRDETNRRMRWTRNRIRLRVLPVLAREVHPGAAAAMARFAGVAGSVARMLESMADGLERKGVALKTADGFSVRARPLARAPEPVRSELWLRLLGRLDGRTAPTCAEVDRIESVLAGDRAADSLRGGRILVRSAPGGLRLLVRKVP